MRSTTALQRRKSLSEKAQAVRDVLGTNPRNAGPEYDALRDSLDKGSIVEEWAGHVIPATVQLGRRPSSLRSSVVNAEYDPPKPFSDSTPELMSGRSCNFGVRLRHWTPLHHVGVMSTNGGLATRLLVWRGSRPLDADEQQAI
jgi:hypothetical protein